MKVGSLGLLVWLLWVVALVFVGVAVGTDLFDGGVVFAVVVWLVGVVLG